MHDIHGVQELVIPVLLTSKEISEQLPQAFIDWAEAHNKNLLVDNYLVFDPTDRSEAVVVDELEDLSAEAAKAPLVILATDKDKDCQQLQNNLTSRGIKVYLLN
jgi:hypothetical protein